MFCILKTTIRVLVNRVTKSWPAYTRRPTEGANLADNQYCTVFAARYAKFEREYIYTGSTCAADFLQCETMTHALVNRAIKPGLAYTVRPTEDASLAKNSYVHCI